MDGSFTENAGVHVEVGNRWYLLLSHTTHQPDSAILHQSIKKQPGEFLPVAFLLCAKRTICIFLNFTHPLVTFTSQGTEHSVGCAALHSQVSLSIGRIHARAKWPEAKEMSCAVAEPVSSKPLFPSLPLTQSWKIFVISIAA